MRKFFVSLFLFSIAFSSYAYKMKIYSQRDGEAYIVSVAVSDIDSIKFKGNDVFFSKWASEAYSVADIDSITFQQDNVLIIDSMANNGGFSFDF